MPIFTVQYHNRIFYKYSAYVYVKKQSIDILCLIEDILFKTKMWSYYLCFVEFKCKNEFGHTEKLKCEKSQNN